MRFASLTAVVAVAVLSASSAFAQSEEVIDLKVGDHKSLSAAGVTRIAVGDTEIADVQVKGDALEITGTGPGKTTLLIWTGASRRSLLLSVQGEKSTAAVKAAPVESANETVSLKVGESRTMPFKYLSRLAIGDPKVADVRLSGDDGITVTAHKAGVTTLIVWRKGSPRYSVRIEVR